MKPKFPHFALSLSTPPKSTAIHTNYPETHHGDITNGPSVDRFYSSSKFSVGCLGCHSIKIEIPLALNVRKLNEGTYKENMLSPITLPHPLIGRPQYLESPRFINHHKPSKAPFTSCCFCVFKLNASQGFVWVCTCVRVCGKTHHTSHCPPKAGRLFLPMHLSLRA